MHSLAANLPLALGLLAPLSFGQDEIKLTGGAVDDETFFGLSVAVDGDTLVVGALEYPHSGSAYVFVRNGARWMLEATLVAEDAAPSDLFGFSVAIDGDTIVVGAPLDGEDFEQYRGSAYVFVRSAGSWSQSQKIEPPLPGSHWQAGHSVAVHGNTLAIGAPRDHGEPGRVALYTRSGGAFELDKTLKQGKTGFGWSVALDGGTCVVGCSDWHGKRPNVAYVFSRAAGIWSKEAKLTVCGTDGYGNDFGRSVALSGDVAVVGDPAGGAADGSEAGAAYVFVRGSAGWTQREKLTSSAGKFADGFGASVAVGGRTAFVGSPGSHAPGSGLFAARAGATYALSSIGSSFATYCDPSPRHSGGTSANIGASGNDAAAPFVTHLECTDGPAGQFGFFLVSHCSPEAAAGKLPGLCLADPIGRYTGLGPLSSLGRFDAAGVLQNVSGTSASGTGYDVPQSLPLSLGGAIQAGETWVFQAWFRDAGGSGFSSAVGVTFR